MKTFQVPFIENPDDRCVPAVIGMVLAYFIPDKVFSMSELEELCGYKRAEGTWKALSMLNMVKLGFKVYWIEDFDHDEFARNPKDYLKNILDSNSYEWQVQHSNLELEASRIKQYQAGGLPLETRQATNDDIRNFIDDGWLVHLEVNARVLSDRDGYEGHSILVIGYDDTGLTIHNPDGESGNKPNQYVSWEKLNKAWKEFGGSFSLYAFKM
jgi:hypothetical protein